VGLLRFDGAEFRHFTTRDGLPHDTVSALHPAADGGLFIGTFGGGLALLPASLDAAGIRVWDRASGLPVEETHRAPLVEAQLDCDLHGQIPSPKTRRNTSPAARPVTTTFSAPSESARAYALAALLQPFVRRLVRGPTPMVRVEAPSEGTSHPVGWDARGRG